MSYQWIFLTLFLFCLSTVRLCAQELNMMSKFTSGEPIYHVEESEISFRLLRHKITVPVYLNDRPEEYTFLLDTGALTFIAEHVAAALELETGQSIPTMDENEKAYLTKLESIRIGEMEVKSFIIPRMDLQAVFDSSFVFDGFIGSDYLRFFKTTIDYRNCLLTLSQPSETTGSSSSGYRIPMEAPLPMRFPYIDITVNDSIRTRAMIDTGSPFALVLPLSFEAQLCSSSRIPCLRSAGTLEKWPATDPPYNCLTRLSTASLGKLVIRNLPVLLTELPMMVNTPLLGKGFLDKYVIELDFPSEHLLLSPVEGTDHDTNVYSAGIGLKKRNDTIIVSGFWEGSPASLSDIQPGDRIFELNGMDARSLTQEDIGAVLDDDAITSIQLGVKRDEGFGVIRLEKKWLLPTTAEPIHRLKKNDHKRE